MQIHQHAIGAISREPWVQYRTVHVVVASCQLPDSSVVVRGPAESETSRCYGVCMHVLKISGDSQLLPGHILLNATGIWWLMTMVSASVRFLFST